MTPFAIAGIQMPITTNSNLDAMRHRLELVLHLYPWVQMVMYSELAPFGPLLPNAQKLPGPAEEAFQEMALKHGVWLLPGSLFERRDGLIFNTAPVINPAGEVVARYRKMFPFRPFEEGVTSGDEFVVFDVPQVGRFGVSICYDIWFPETSRTLTAMGAEVLLHPVLTHTIDRDVDLNLARATAAFCQCYVFDINGLHAGGNGQSAVIDPAGRTLHQAGVNEEMIPIEVDLDQVRRQRQYGLRGLGQPLKSFRDSNVDFSIYDQQRRDLSYLSSLGPLAKPQRAAIHLDNPPQASDPGQLDDIPPAADPGQLDNIPPAVDLGSAIVNEAVPAETLDPVLNTPVSTTGQ
ncbi:MAG: carbon-nitrogen hydrolase family protein [Candidatus Competibacteraceae bacterium]|nr:carbon-nitrogen hydrolase family protein [Candidatus Competibacteraceae bacterium]